MIPQEADARLREHDGSGSSRLPDRPCVQEEAAERAPEGSVDRREHRVVIFGLAKPTLPGDRLAAQLSRVPTRAMVDGPAARCLSVADASEVVERELDAVRLRERAARAGYGVVIERGFIAAHAPDGREKRVRPAVNADGTVLIYLAAVPVGND